MKCFINNLDFNLYFRRTLKYYKEQLKMKSKRSRLLIMAIADKLNEKEMEIIKVGRHQAKQYLKL